MLLDAVTLGDERPLKDNAPFLVPLALLGGKLVHPAQLGVAVLARHVAHHVAPRQHHPVLHLTEVEVDDLVEEECSPRSSCEPRAYQLAAIRQDGVAACAREEPGAADVFEKYAAHVCGLRAENKETTRGAETNHANRPLLLTALGLS